MNLHHIPLDHLKVCPLNMRHGRRKPKVDDLVPSIRQRGILQPLLVKPSSKADHYEIYAGRRRFFAMKEIAKAEEAMPMLPCLVLDASTDAEIVEASILENTARLAPDEMEQYEAFQALANKGRSIAEIADTFGVTTLMVKRRLALANLLPEIREAYTQENIDIRTLTALTLASASQQTDWLALLQSEDEHAPLGAQLKAWLCGGDHITTKAALFSLEDYNGEILTDLFGEEAVFANVETFWTHQNSAIAALRDATLRAGWSHCIVLERGAYFTRWDYAEASKEEGGTVYIEVARSGDITVHEGYIIHGRSSVSARLPLLA